MRGDNVLLAALVRHRMLRSSVSSSLNNPTHNTNNDAVLSTASGSTFNASDLVETSSGAMLLVMRCEDGVSPRLSPDGACSCNLASTEDGDADEYTLCESDENDSEQEADGTKEERTWSSVCIEDVTGRSAAVCGVTSTTNHGSNKRRSGKKVDQRDKVTCPEGYGAVKSSLDDADGDANGDAVEGVTVCRDIASRHSCGAAMRDCTQARGALMTECVMGRCETQMCQDGYRFVRTGDRLECVAIPVKPAFY